MAALASTETLAATACPLCRGPNGCGPAHSGSFSGPCWCESASFSAALLERVPDDLRRSACICAACAAEHPC